MSMKISRIILVIGFILFSRTSVYADQYNFTLDNPSAYGTSTWSHFVVASDFNNDGYLDLVVTCEFSKAVDIFINNGDGTFKNKVSYSINNSASGGPVGLSVADLNLDGKLDIVVGGGYGSNQVIILLGNGLAGSGNPLFLPQQSYTIGQEPIYLTARDVNGDGYPDIISPNEADGTLGVLINNQNGTFGSLQSYQAGATYWAGAGDFNGDGFLDLGVMSCGGNLPDCEISIFKNSGAGTFSFLKYVGLGTHESAIGDINGDGIPDLITANKAYNTISVFVNDGAANFTETKYDAGANPGWVEIADLNKDGFNDLIVCNQGSQTFQVFISDGNGNFSNRITYDIPSISYQATAADLNGDGLLDIITANAPANSLSVFLQKVSIATSSNDTAVVAPNQTSLALDGNDTITTSSISATPASVSLKTASIKSSVTTSVGAITHTIDGGPGIDTVKYNYPKVNYSMTNNNGVWTIVDNVNSKGTDTLKKVEYVQFSDQTVQIGTVPNTINGTAMNNSLSGGTTDDFVFGLAGNDTITAGAGNDYVDGGTGNDIISEGVGNDMSANSLGTDTYDGGADIDTIDYANATAAISLTLNGSIQITMKMAGVNKDKLKNIENVIGGALNDTLTGDGLNNVLSGGAGNDSLNGAGGNDSIKGGDGNDTINGGAGNDTIAAGLGTDTITGGSGVDTFRFLTITEIGLGASKDTVTDFVSGTDKIDLSAIDANTRIGGRQPFTFIVNKAFSKVAGQLRFVNGVLSGDLDGDGVANFEIALTRLSSLNISDLRL